MRLHQPLDGLTLAGAGVSEAQMAGEQVPDAQFIHTQLGIAALTVADNEQPVLFCQLFQGFLHQRVADAALIFLQIAVFRIHAPFHQLIALGNGDGCKEGITDLGHHLAEEGTEGFRVGAEMVQTLPAELDVVSFGHQGTGVPEGAVNIKNQTFKIHIMPPAVCGKAQSDLPGGRC